MTVSTQHPDYTKFFPQWKQVRDCVAGSAAIKAAGTTYLPKPNEVEEDSEARYDQYKLRALFAAFTAHTKDGLLGLAFRRATEIDLPPQIEYLEANADGVGATLDQATRDIVADVLETGRYGLLAEYPQVDSEPMTETDEQALGVASYIVRYPAESITNWRTDVASGKKRLVQIVLQEVAQKPINQFETETVTTYRVLALEDGVYTQTLYGEDDTILAGPIIPTKQDGTPFDVIPFAFIGAQNNDETPDKSPLIDISDVNIAHYRNSADYEESAFLVGQPMLSIIGLNTSWIKENMKNGVVVGSRRALLLPMAASVDLIQVAPNSMPFEGMAAKESQMIALGARLIRDAGGVETAEAAKIRFTGQTSRLAVIVGNVESAVVQVLGWVSEFMGAGIEAEDIIFNLNRDFYDRTVDPQAVAAGIQLVDRGVIARSDLQLTLKRGGLLGEERTTEDIESETSAVNPLT
jgi:hypothetical protein